MTASDESIRMATIAAQAAASKLAQDITVIDVSGQLVITDCFVIASASNERQAGAIVDEVEDKMRAAGHKPARREGAREGRWVLLDFIDIVVHVQHQDERNFYALDRLWRDCPTIEVDLESQESRDRSPPGHAAAWANRLQRRKPHAGSARHRTHGPRQGPGGGRRRGSGQTPAAADRVVGSAARLRHGSGTRRTRRVADPGGRPAARNAFGDWQGLTHTQVDEIAPGARAAWRDDATLAPHGGESRIDVANRSVPPSPTSLGRTGVGCGQLRQARRSGAHGGLIAALTAALLGLPVTSWPALGDGQRQLGAAVGPRRRRCGVRGDPVASGRGTPRLRLPTMSSEAHPKRPALLVFADSLSYYGPAGGLPADDPGSGRISLPPNLTGISSWLAESAGHAAMWWAATQDPDRGRRCRGPGGGVRHWRNGFASITRADGDSGTDPLPRPPRLRRLVRNSYEWVQRRFSPISPIALPPHLTAEYLEMTRAAVDFNRPGIPIVASLPSVHIADGYGRAHQGRQGTVDAITAWAGQHQIPWST